MSADESSAQGGGSKQAPISSQLEELMSMITPIKDEVDNTHCTQSYTKPCVVIEMLSPGVPEAGHQQEIFGLFLAVELTKPFGEDVRSRAVPPYAWTTNIIMSYLRDIINPSCADREYYQAADFANMHLKYPVQLVRSTPNFYL